MSDESYIDREFKYVPEAHQSLKVHIKGILSIIGEEGHSGGSMGVYSGMMEYWRKDPTEPEENSLHYPIWVYLKEHVKVEYHKQVLEYVSKLMTFTPLSSLTGEEDEWNLVYEDETETTYQNNRMSNVFKTNTKGPYWLDGEIHHHPSSDADWWLGITGNFSCKEITFPFDPNTKPIIRYFEDSDCTKELKTNPHLWLRERKRRALLGFNVEENKDEGTYVYQRVILETTRDVNKVLEAIKHYYSFNHKLSIREIDNKLNEMRWKTHDNKAKLPQAESDYFHTLFEKKDGKENRQYKIILNTHAQVFNFLRLITEIGVYEFISQDELAQYLILNPVLMPTRHYQQWIAHSDKTHISFNCFKIVEYDPYNSSPVLEISDKSTHLVLGTKYLYERCKALGLVYKGRK